MWKIGDLLQHRHNRTLGTGIVVEADSRSVTVEFRDAGSTMRLAVGSDTLVAVSIQPGIRARLEPAGEVVTVAERVADRAILTDGRTVEIATLWPLPKEEPPIERLARGQLDAAEDFLNRLDAVRLQRLRQSSGLGSFLGGRIKLYPHQLYAAERACRNLPVRWLLADEVGLGKTVEACLILNRLLHTGHADRTLIIAPETLTLQWLGELWRKHHQVFVLIDDKRLLDIEKEHGKGFNPLEVYRRAILGLETLLAHQELASQAAAVGIDLVVVDEAHRLRRPPGHPGNPAYRAVAPLIAAARHALLLTATPLEDDAHGFLRLLQLLRPEEFPESAPLVDRLERREPLPPITSATRRVDIGGLPPRVGRPLELSPAAWEPLLALEAALASQPAGDALAARRKAERIALALASPAAFLTQLGGEETALLALARAAAEADPRPRWLAEEAERWRQRREKVLVFVASLAMLQPLKATLEGRSVARVGIFHEELAPERRDIEVAQFRLADGPAVLISTECGGEGRNFEFCHRLVLFDLPWSPLKVEQRIGRLDRIGRTMPTEIVYFKPSGGLGRTVAELYERIGLFAEPLSGLEHELAPLAAEIEKAAVAGAAEAAQFDAVLAAANAARDRIHEAAWHELHREPYGAAMAAGILARVPPDLEELTQEVVLRALARFGFGAEEQSGRATYLVELGAEGLIDHLPGVPGGSSFLGTFDREEGVEKESIDFFSSGHPLIEGILAELEDGPRGRAAVLQLRGPEDTSGLLVLYRHGVDTEAVVVDQQGRMRPDLAQYLTTRTLKSEPFEVKKWTTQAAWPRSVRRLAEALPQDEGPFAAAVFRMRRRP